MTTAKRTVTKVSDALTPSSDEATAEVGEPSAADAMWAAMMIPHHQEGIEMAEMAMSRAETESLRKAAEGSKQEQEEDMLVLEQIISAAGKSPMPPEKPIDRMNKHQMKVLESLTGAEFDRHWITVTQGHHMAAIMMTDTAMAASGSETARTLQQKLRDAQLQEMDTLTAIHDQLHD